MTARGLEDHRDGASRQLRHDISLIAAVLTVALNQYMVGIMVRTEIMLWVTFLPLLPKLSTFVASQGEHMSASRTLDIHINHTTCRNSALHLSDHFMALELKNAATLPPIFNRTHTKWWFHFILSTLKALGRLKDVITFGMMEIFDNLGAPLE